MQEVVAKAVRQYRCVLDGGITEDKWVKVCSLRLEDGLMISLLQTMVEDEIEKEYEKIIMDEGTTAIEKEGKLDPKAQELRRLFESIKL